MSSRRLDRLLGRRRRAKPRLAGEGRAVLALLAHAQAQAGGPRFARTRAALRHNGHFPHRAFQPVNAIGRLAGSNFERSDPAGQVPGAGTHRRLKLISL